jgi:hypothetical protein
MEEQGPSCCYQGSEKEGRWKNHFEKKELVQLWMKLKDRVRVPFDESILPLDNVEVEQVSEATNDAQATDV